ncbi:MAG: MFS transporter [Nocardioidaceae bacterium]
MRLPDTLAPLRERGFAWFYTARTVSTLGSNMAPVALAFAVLDVSDSASALGVVLAARTIPMVAFLLFGGVLADRWDRAVVMRVSHVLSALSQGAAAALVLTGTAQIWMLVAIEAVNGTVSAFSFPAMASIVTQLVPRERLQQANALLSMSRSGLTILGPTVAALVVATAGPGWALGFDALTWLVAAGCLLPVVLPPRAAATGESASLFRELREGWTVFTGTTWLWLIVAVFSVLNAIHMGAWFTLGPAIAKHSFGAGGWGLVLSAESVGTLLCTVVLLKVRLRHPLRAGMLACGVFSVPLFLLGTTSSVPALMAGALAAGIGMEVFGMGWNLAMQENIEERMLSRAYSYDAVGSFVAMPVGQIAAGPVAEAFGYHHVIVAGAVVYGALAFGTLAARSVWRMERLPVPAGAPVGAEPVQA